jgi:UDP-N-acetylglucosamine 3-dehydrogenase
MTETGKARIAFIGCGSHCRMALLPSMPQLTNADLVAVCDVQADLAETAARQFGALRWYTDHRRMLGEEQLDGVCVIGSPQMHVELGLEVLAAGLPLFVEKPSAINVAEAERLARAADAAELWGVVAFMKRHSVGYRMAKEIVSRPEFGAIEAVSARWGQGDYPSIWGIESPALSFLTGQVVHIFDLVQAFCGPAAEVFARYQEVTANAFAFAVNVHFASGAVGSLDLNTIDATQAWRDFTERLILSGHGAHVTIDNMLGLTYLPPDDWLEVPDLNIGRLLKIWQPTGPAVRKAEEVIGYRGELAHFADCCLRKQPATASLWDGVAALGVTEAVWESVQTGRNVTIGS